MRSKTAEARVRGERTPPIKVCAGTQNQKRFGMKLEPPITSHFSPLTLIITPTLRISFGCRSSDRFSRRRLKVHFPNVGASLPQQVCDQMPSNEPTGATHNNFCTLIHSEGIGLTEYRDPIKKNSSRRGITVSASAASLPATRVQFGLGAVLQHSITPRGRIRGRGQPARRSLWFVGFELRRLAKSGERSALLARPSAGRPFIRTSWSLLRWYERLLISRIR